jgi:hypothetical protein
MHHVKTVAKQLGIDHQFIPPHQQSLNEAEKVCDFAFESARALMEHSDAPDHMFGLAVSYVLYVDLRSATTASRQWLTPYELTHGVRPSIAKLHRFWTRCYVAVPKSKRKALAAKGLHNMRGEPGRFVGFHSPQSSTYAVMLDGDRDRLVHNLNVTFDDQNFNSRHATAPLPPSGLDVDVHGARGEEAKYEPLTDASVAPEPEAEPTAVKPLSEWPEPYVSVPPLPKLYHDPENTAWQHELQEPKGRPRPSYAHQMACYTPETRSQYANCFSCFSITPTAALFEHETTSIPSVFDNLEEAQSTDWLMNQPDRYPDLIAQDQRVLNCLLTMDAGCTEALECCLQVLAESGADYQTYDSICYHLALAASKDISWAEALKGPDAAKAIEALEAEMKSLNDTILTEIHPDDPEYSDAVRLATSGRFRTAGYQTKSDAQGTWCQTGFQRKQGAS